MSWAMRILSGAFVVLAAVLLLLAIALLARERPARAWLVSVACLSLGTGYALLRFSNHSPNQVPALSASDNGSFYGQALQQRVGNQQWQRIRHPLFRTDDSIYIRRITTNRDGSIMIVVSNQSDKFVDLLDAAVFFLGPSLDVIGDSRCAVTDAPPIGQPPCLFSPETLRPGYVADVTFRVPLRPSLARRDTVLATVSYVAH